MRCWICGGSGAIDSDGEDEVCEACEGNGIHHFASAPEEALEGTSAEKLDARDAVMLAFASRERPPTPGEWLDYPAKYVSAYRLILAQLGEIEREKKSEADRAS